VPTFHFNVHGDQSPAEGVELASVADAKNTAARYVARLLTDQAPSFWEAGHIGLSVSDETGLTLFTIEILGTDAPAIRVEVPHPQ
jgi:hypothetical protein